MTAPEFHHTDDGTPEPHWLLAPEWDDVPRLDLAALFDGRRRLVVASAHPDDETLGAALLMTAAHDLGIEVVLVLATAGEASHPDSRTWTQEMLVEARSAEIARAVEILAPGSPLVHLGLPDSGLADDEDRLVAELTRHVDGTTVLVAPWSHDGHADHDALGRAARTCARSTGALLLHYPIWLWHWGTPADLPWSRAMTLSGSPSHLRRKAEALAAHRSQVEPLSPLPGDEPVVGADVTTRAERLIETYFLAAADTDADSDAVREIVAAESAQDATPFDEMYDAGDDPWGFADSFYEARKRDLVLAMLRRERYDSALEIGCADGHLTERLAQRCESVTAIDVSAEALVRARAREIPGATFVRGAAPAAIEGEHDLVVLSEVGYFMDPADWLATLRRCRRALRPGGEIVLVHWQHDTTDVPLDGRFVHAQAATMLDLERTAHYADADVIVDIYGGPRSIATEEA